MKVATVGSVVRAYRRASGLSQKDLAEMVGISRATLNYLESGRDLEIGAGKLLALLSVLGVPFSIPAEVDRARDDEVLDKSAKAIGAKGHKKVMRTVVVEAFSTGRIPIGYERPLTQLLETLPDAAVLPVIRAVCGATGQAPATVWKHAASLAGALGSTREIWLDEES